MQVIKQKDLIWGLLLNNPRFRDNDQALMSHIWSLEIPNLNITNAQQIVNQQIDLINAIHRANKEA